MKTKYRVRVYQDEMAESPRDWDNLGTMVCWHKRDNLGDEQPIEDPEVWRESLSGEQVIMLPLWLIDHSGLSISTGNFDYCDPGRWDSGQVGWIYATYERIEEVYGEITKETLNFAENALQGEVETYDYYLQGYVYGFTVEKYVRCAACKHVEMEFVDGCGGFFGPITESGMMESLTDAGVPDDIRDMLAAGDLEQDYELEKAEKEENTL